MTTRELNSIIKSINNSNMSEEEKDSLVVNLLDSVQNNKEEGEEEFGLDNKKKDSKPKKQEKLKNDDLHSIEEEQMQIHFPGTSICKEPRKDGRYQGYVLRKDGSKKYFYGSTRKEVIDKIRYSLNMTNEQFQRYCNKQYYIPDARSFDYLDYYLINGNGTMTSPMYQNNVTKGNEMQCGHPFNEFYESWIENYKKPNVKPKSLDSIKTTLRRAVDKFGDTPIEMITTDDIQSLLVSINGGRIRDMCKINLSQIFKKAILQGIIVRNPCDAVEIKKHKEQHKKALTIAEQDKFLAVIKNTPHSLLFRLMLSTGLRIGEALALTKSDIDFENCKLKVNKNVVFINSKRVVQDTPKSEAGNRTIPIPKDICDELKKIKGTTLFPVTYNAVKLWMNKMCKKEDMKMTLHTLRHTYATRLEEAGIPPKVKQYLLGHASLEMTQNTYTDTQEQYVDSLSEKVRAVF